MFNLLSKARKDKSGFSLVELLVVLLIMSVLAGIAVPLYLNQKQRSYMSIAQADTTAVGQEVSSITLGYTSFGSAPGTIGLSSGAISFSPMTAATGVGLYSATGPGTTTSIPRLSAGSSVSGSYGAGTGTTWCLIIVNNGAYSQYTNAGLVTSGVGGTLPTCVGGVALAPGAGPYTFAFTSQSGLPAVASWYSIASSSDGTRLAICGGVYVYTSTDSGVSWTAHTVAPAGKYLGWITSSADGTRLATAVFSGSGDIFTSTDSGATWTDRSGAGTRNWSGITSSSDGSHITAISFGWNTTSSADGGATWTTPVSGGGGFGWDGLASDSTGQYLAVIIAGGIAPFTSSNYGSTWTQHPGATGSAAFDAIASSSDGSHLVAAVGNGSGYMWTSTNFGVSWTQQTGSGSRPWYSVASSSDGTHLAATSTTGGTIGDIYTSADSGVTWVDQSGAGSKYWFSVASNTDGKKLAAADWGGTVTTGIGS